MATINDARIAGLRAGMEPADPRIVPAKFSHNEALAAAWLAAYDDISTAMLNQRPDVMEAPAPAKAARRTTDKEDIGIKRLKPKAAPKPTMMAILERQLAEHA